MRFHNYGHKMAGFSLCFLLILASCQPGERHQIDITENEEADIFKNELPPEEVGLYLPQELIKIGFVQAGHESDWRVATTANCKEVFSEENGYELLFADADNAPKAQIKAVRSFIKEEVDYIIIDPILPTGWTAVLKEAYRAAVPVFIINQAIDCDPRYYKAWYGPDFVLQGECAGQWLRNYLNRKSRSRETIHIVAINGTLGTSAQIGRTKGFAKYLEFNENWKLLAQADGNFTESGGRQVMETYLEQYPDIDVVICQNDNEAMGAIRALEDAGVAYGKNGGMILISFDATRAGLKAVMQGKIHADFESSPLASACVAQAIQKLEAGEEPGRKMYFLPEACFASETPMVLLTEDGAKQMEPVTEELLSQRAY